MKPDREHELHPADIEIYEATDSDKLLNRPRYVRVNGQELVLASRDDGQPTIEFGPLNLGKGVVEVTIRGIVCNSLSIGRKPASERPTIPKRDPAQDGATEVYTNRSKFPDA